ncbi:MAG: hypothetical protein R3C61_25775 [Bacteroidia bacterium]
MRFPLRWILVCLPVLWACGLGDWVSQPPLGVHQWRQADGAAMMWFYYQGNSFFQPEIFNLETTDYGYAVGELPFTYWIAGKIAVITGWNVSLLRWVHLVIFLAGIGSLVWILRQTPTDHLLLVLVVNILVSTPVIAYYSANYLPDSPALSLVFVSWALLFQGYRRNQNRWLYAAAVVAALAACLKLTLAVSWVATALTLALVPGKFQHISTALRRHFLLSTFFWGILIAGCRIWIMRYNTQFDSTYFLASLRPVWQYSVSDIYNILLGLKYELKGILSPGTGIGMAWVVYLLVKNHRQIHSGLLVLILLHIAGLVTIVLLFFRMYREHDYYTLALWVSPVLMVRRSCP